MIKNFRRVSLHPYVAMLVLRRALASHSSPDQSVESRRTMSEIIDVVDSVVTPEDGGFENPYALISRYEASERRKKNEALLAEHGDNAQFMFDKGYRPLPNKDLRRFFDFTSAQLKIASAAIEAYARRPDVTHDLDKLFVDACDAIASALDIEIDTSKITT